MSIPVGKIFEESGVILSEFIYFLMNNHKVFVVYNRVLDYIQLGKL